MPVFKFREAVIPEDLPTILRIRNEFYSRPISLEELGEAITRVRASIRTYRAIVAEDGVENGYGLVWKHPTEEPSVFWTRNFTYAEEAFLALHRHLESHALTGGAQKVLAWARTCAPQTVAGLELEGYREVQRNPESCLELGEMNPSMRQVVDQVTAMGYEIIDLPELERRFPDTYRHLAWRTEMDLMCDVPLPLPFEETPFDEFEKQFESSFLVPEAIFYALKDKQIVGHTGLSPSHGDPEVCGTGLTGVLRNHRRKGLATALKLTSYEWAVRQGIRRVFTDNEEGNPMFDLNRALGFRRLWDWLYMEKSF